MKRPPYLGNKELHGRSEAREIQPVLKQRARTKKKPRPVAPVRSVPVLPDPPAIPVAKPKWGEPSKRQSLLAADPFCHYCGHELTIDTATLDHVVPRSKGGSNAMNNLVLACKPCNGAKGSMSHYDFNVARDQKILAYKTARRMVPISMTPAQAERYDSLQRQFSDLIREIAGEQ